VSPYLPEIAARSGRTIGSGSHARSSRLRRGQRPGRLARSRRAEDHEHARDARAREPADVVEPAHDLRVPAEEDRGVLFLEMGEAGIGAAAWLEGEGRRVEARALQAFLEAPIGMRVAGKIDVLLVDQIRRNLALIDPDERGDDLLAHEPRGVDLRPAPARREPLLRDERQDDLAAPSGLLQGFLPALTGRDAALGVEIEEDVIPAVLREPVADLDRLVVIPARMADEKARHGLMPTLVKWLQVLQESCAIFAFCASRTRLLITTATRVVESPHGSRRRAVWGGRRPQELPLWVDSGRPIQPDRQALGSNRSFERRAEVTRSRAYGGLANGLAPSARASTATTRHPLGALRRWQAAGRSSGRVDERMRLMDASREHIDFVICPCARRYGPSVGAQIHVIVGAR
jgi:hypothetical protein